MRADSMTLPLLVLLVAVGVSLAWLGRPRARAQEAGSTSPAAEQHPVPGKAATDGEPKPPDLPELTADEKRVILEKGTERAFTGEFDKHFAEGVYTCRNCGAMLYRSDDKFPSHCGWPAFDDEIPGAVTRVPDADGARTEILCSNCGGHLGHVFLGEGLTEKDTRHCVNSISLDFKPAEEVVYGRALFAGGCFWGVEYWLQRQPGVLATTVGYTGGHTGNPTYESMHQADTGHAEAVEVIYDPVRVSYEELAKLFFETHDPTQHNRQGPDIGAEYRSAIFCVNEDQKRIAEALVAELEERGLKIATQIVPAGEFWTGEDYHQDWYTKKNSPPACHARKPLWDAE